MPTFFTLIRALAETNLLGTVIKSDLTFFAPTDAAFRSIGITPKNVDEVPNLESILLYHVVPGLVFSDDLSEGSVTTANGADVEVSFDNGYIIINESKVIKADVRALHSVLHIVDQVLLPPMDDNDMEEELTIGDIVTNAAKADEAKFTVLLAALKRAPDLLAAATST